MQIQIHFKNSYLCPPRLRQTTRMSKLSGHKPGPTWTYLPNKLLPILKVILQTSDQLQAYCCSAEGWLYEELNAELYRRANVSISNISNLIILTLPRLKGHFADGTLQHCTAEQCIKCINMYAALHGCCMQSRGPTMNHQPST